jgi:dienelactone hydrolase
MFETTSYEVDGRSFVAVAAAPPGEATRPGVLVFHGGSGLGEHERDRVRALAALGYVALAPDLFGAVFADRAHGMRVIGELVAEPERLRARTTAALRCLIERPRVDARRTLAIGHCFGGLAALELARSGAELRGVVSFHGGLATRAPARRGDVRASVLAFTGAGDPFCPRDQRVAFEDEMTAAGVDWQHHILAGVQHGFTVPGVDPARHPGSAYDARADRRAWAGMQAFFDEVLGGA